MDKETLQGMIFQQLIDNAFDGFVKDDVIVLDGGNHGQDKTFQTELGSVEKSQNECEREIQTA